MNLGLTGGIGCGKSTATERFAAEGWRTLQADAIVRDLLRDDAAVRAALAERWGASVWRDDGAVDRRAVAAKVFADEAELAWLEELLHPRVRRVYESAMEAEPAANWVVEIPLLFEKKLETRFSFVVCVSCSCEAMRRRMRRRGFSDDALERRRSRQSPLEDKRRRADFVLSNSGSLEFLERQIETLDERLRVRAPRSEPSSP